MRESVPPPGPGQLPSFALALSGKADILPTFRACHQVAAHASSGRHGDVCPSSRAQVMDALVAEGIELTNFYAFKCSRPSHIYVPAR